MSSTSPLNARLRALGAVSCLALLAVACGDDDDTTAGSGENASADVDAYCDLIEELDSQDDLPSEEQLLRLKEIRPDAVGEDTDAVADAFIEADGDVGKVFADPEMENRFERLEEHDAEVCGFETEEGDEEEEMDTEAAEGAEIIAVTAVDFEFEGVPDEVSAGPVAFELTNDGEAAHEMAIFKLGDGVDLDEILASDEEPSDDDAQEVGGTFAPPGEGGVYANVDLEPGTYALVCFIPGPGGKPHHELGMKKTFEVV